MAVDGLFEGQLPGPFDFFLRLVNTGATDPADEAVPTTVTGDGRVQLSDPHQVTKQVVLGVSTMGVRDLQIRCAERR